MEVRKRTHVETSPTISVKRARYDYLCIESDDFLSSSDYESVNSLQDKETDVVKDTSDMSDESDASEYEPISTDEEAIVFECSSSSGMEDIIATEGGYITIFETSLNAWATDCEDSDTSSGSAYGLRGFRYCIQCKSENNNPQFRYCEKCFQQRKSTFPPRPRPNKPRKEKINENSDGADSGATILSQDSGIGNENPKQGEGSQVLWTEDIKKLTNGEELTDSKESGKEIVDSTNESIGRKDCISRKDSSITKPQDSLTTTTKDVATTNEDKNSGKQEATITSTEEILTVSEEPKDNQKSNNRKRRRDNDDLLMTDELPAKTRLVTGLNEEKELCIICNSNMKDSIFLHGRIAHMCCCYKCSVKTWKINKRCPMCNCIIKNVVKVFKS